MSAYQVREYDPRNHNQIIIGQEAEAAGCAVLNTSNVKIR